MQFKTTRMTNLYNWVHSKIAIEKNYRERESNLFIFLKKTNEYEYGQLI